MTSKRKILLPVTVGITIGIGVFFITVFCLALVDGRRDVNEESSTIFNRFSPSSSPAEKDHLVLADPTLRLPATFEQIFQLYILVARSDEKDLRLLLERSAKIPHFRHRHFIQNLVYRRFATIDPKGTLEQIGQLLPPERDPAINGLFKEWSLSDLDAAIEGALVLNHPAKRLATQTILKTRDDLSENYRLDIAKQLGYEELGQQLLGEANIANYIENPEAAWHHILNDDHDDSAQEDLLIRIAEYWIEQEGNEVISQLISSFSDLFEDDFNQFNSFNLLNSILEKLARDDPIGILDALATVSTRVQRIAMQTGIIYSWASDDPRSVLAKIEQIPIDLQWLAKRNAMVQIAQSSPTEAVHLLEQTANDTTREAVGFSLVAAWGDQDVLAALDWVLSEPAIEDLRSDMVRILLPRLALVDPQRALEMAMKQPTTLHYMAPVAEVISALVKTNVEEAIGMLSHIGEHSKLTTYKSVASELIRNKDVERAFQLAPRLTEQQRNTYLKYVVRQWAIDSPLDLYEEINQLDSKQVRSHAALMLLAFNERGGNLSETQVTRVKSFLSESDARELTKYKTGEKWLGNYEEH